MDNWKQYKGKIVRLIIEDTPFPKHKDGVFINSDSTHVFLKIIDKDLPIPFLKTTIRRVDIKDGE
jgi:hypothetical protein